MFNNDAERQLAAYRKVRAYISVCHLMDLVFGTISFFPSMSNVLRDTLCLPHLISSLSFITGGAWYNTIFSGRRSYCGVACPQPNQPPQPQPRLAQTPLHQCIVSTSARALNNRIKGLTDIPLFAKVLELADRMKLGGSIRRVRTSKDR